MTLEELIKVKESLEELEATAEKFNWGPSQAFAQQRQKEAIRIVKREIKFLQNKETERAEAKVRRAEMKEIRSKLGYSRIGRNNI
jgi:hypothetical protein